MADAAQNRFNTVTRAPLWMVTYEMDAAFYELGADEQYQFENLDAIHSASLAFELEWKAAYTTTDFKTGWLLFKVADQQQAEAVIKSYPLYKHFQNITYTPVYSATQGGFNGKILWSGFKEFVKAAV